MRERLSMVGAPCTLLMSVVKLKTLCVWCYRYHKRTQPARAVGSGRNIKV